MSGSTETEAGWRSTLVATWRGNDPTRSACLQWLGRSGETVEVELSTEEGSSTTSSDVAPFGDSDWTRHRATLTGLEPGTRYRITVDGADSGWSVRTAPEEFDEPLTFAEGGDLGIGSAVADLHRRAANWDPLFALVGGDLAYANGQDASRWVPFLQQWNQYMRSGDRLVPIVAAIGNHEVRGGMHGNPEEAPFFYSLFDNAHRDHAYWALDIGDYLSVLVLDSNHSTEIPGRQTEWLEGALDERRNRDHVMALYHVPAYPSAKPITGAGRDRADVRDFWVPLFEEYTIDVAFEHDDHAYKRTYLLEDGEPSPESGILYVGDGAWGKGPREVKNRPYLKVAKSSLNVIRTNVFPDGSIRFLAVDSAGEVLDSFDDGGNDVAFTPTTSIVSTSRGRTPDASAGTDVRTRGQPGFGATETLGGVLAAGAYQLTRDS